MLLTSLELLDSPLALVVLVVVLSELGLLGLFRDLKRASGCVFGQVEPSHAVSSYFVIWTCCFDFEGELQLVLGKLFYHWDDPERRLVVLLGSVTHYQELSVWRRDGQSAQLVEVIRVNALVESAVVKHHSRLVWRLTDVQIIVEHKSQARVAAKVTLHLDDAID